MQCPKCGNSKLVKSGKQISKGKRQRYQCTECGCRTTNPDQSITPEIQFASAIPKCRRYLITSAQNATPVHKPFFASLQKYARHQGMELIVIPFRYRNPTSAWARSNEDHEWWAEGLAPFLASGRFDLSDRLTVMADVKVQPTAVTPLTGLESLTGERSAIIGHTKVQMKTVATPAHKLPKVLTTTGAVTVENYSDTKAGKKGEFHHSLGAVVVELARGMFHQRQISACSDGSFIDLEYLITPKSVRKAPPAEALILGDAHVDFIDPQVEKATFGLNGIRDTINPKRLVWHDLLDFYSANHHHRGDPFQALAKFKAGMGNVEAEVRRACEFVNRRTPNKCQSIIVPSNHNDAMSRWLAETDWRQDPENAEFYLETALAVARSTRMKPNKAHWIPAFDYWAEKLITVDKTILGRGESYTVQGVEFGMHGDKGVNGARGSTLGFARIGGKSWVGHGHYPEAFEGARRVGTSSYLKLGYNNGLSSWLNAHGVQYANGKRAIITIVNGKWRM